eukprot:2983467-Prymnesium_polylepis.1
MAHGKGDASQTADLPSCLPACVRAGIRSLLRFSSYISPTARLGVLCVRRGGGCGSRGRRGGRLLRRC